jgi:hypothetical protein
MSRRWIVQLKTDVFLCVALREGGVLGARDWPSAEASETFDSRLASSGRTACCGDLSLRKSPQNGSLIEC